MLTILALIDEEDLQEKGKVISLYFTVIITFIAIVSIFKDVFAVVLFFYVDLDIDVYEMKILPNRPKHFCNSEEPLPFTIASTKVLKMEFLVTTFSFL